MKSSAVRVVQQHLRQWNTEFVMFAMEVRSNAVPLVQRIIKAFELL